MRDIAAEALFEVVALDLTGENADKFTKVVEDDRLQRFVRKVCQALGEPSCTSNLPHVANLLDPYRYHAS